MATNWMLQQKQKSGCLKGGSAVTQRRQSLWEAIAGPSASEAPVAPPQQQQQQHQYALAAVSGLKIRLTRKDSQSLSAAGTDGDGASSASPSGGPEAVETAPALLLESSDGEDLLEEEGDESDVDSSTGVATAPAPPPPPSPPPAAPTCVVDFGSGRRSIVATVGDCSCDSVGAGIRRLMLVATAPLAACDSGDWASPLLTLRGLALADLIDRLYDRQLALVAEAFVADSEDDDKEAAAEAAGSRGLGQGCQLLLLPAARLPWPSLAVHRPPAPPVPPTPPPPDWWREWDGPPSDVNLNCLRRSDAFMQQFPDQAQG